MSDTHASDTGFPPGVAEQFEFYVYRLVDPRDGNIFYVGKGRGNRGFTHAHGHLSFAAVGDDEGLGTKRSRVNEILVVGLVPTHVIRRHGLSSETAFEVEAALIDAYPGLTNLQGGHGSNDRGAMHVKQIIEIYQQQVADFGTDPVLVTKVSSSLEERTRYYATREAWKLVLARAEIARYVVAAQHGTILEVYEPERWASVTGPDFAGLGFGPG